MTNFGRSQRNKPLAIQAVSLPKDCIMTGSRRGRSHKHGIFSNERPNQAHSRAFRTESMSMDDARDYRGRNSRSTAKAGYCLKRQNRTLHSKHRNGLTMPSPRIFSASVRRERRIRVPAQAGQFGGFGVLALVAIRKAMPLTKA